MMLKYIRNSRTVKFISSFMALSIVLQIIAPMRALALTSGPSQPEVQSFEPIGTNQMVDVFSGDFSYNIPLLDVGGYPINISYHAGIGMDQDASWVGLGWNINPGVVNRNMRGIPDDFNGTEKIKQTTNLRPNWELLLKTNLSKKHKEFFGYPEPQYGNSHVIGVFYNNYKGVGFDYSFQKAYEKGAAFSIGYNSFGGINAAVGYKSLSMSYNSTYGLQALSFHKTFKPHTGENQKIVEVSFNDDVVHIHSEKVGDHAKSGHSLSGVAFFNPSYMPTASPDMYSSSFELNLKFGRVKPKGLFSAREIDAYLTVSGIREDKKEKETPAFGYFYMENAGDDGLTDFNRDNELNPQKRLEHLPTTVLTHDVYSVTGQGTGGVFRPYRSRVGVVGNPKFNLAVSSPNVGLGVEYGQSPGGDFHLGLDLKGLIRHVSSNKWDVGIFDNYSYAKPTSGAAEDYESWYFKSSGEITPVDEDFYDKVGRDKAMWVKLDGANVKSTKLQLDLSDGSSKTPETIARAKREKRNQPIFTLTGGDKDYCLQKEILSYSTNEYGLTEKTSISRTSTVRKSNHITEVTSTNTDGSRYVYGVPAYNTVYKEVSFAIDKPSTRNDRKGTKLCQNKGLVSYDSIGTHADNGTGNENGIDYFFSSTETPAYAHSYLLSAVLSPDYVDVDYNGPTTNDLGNYTRFNYTRVTDKYKWRAPFDGTKNKAAFLEGNKSDQTDDRASYVYGEKEIWYLFTVETKTHIAEFILNDPETNPRFDGFDAATENGGIGSSKLRYLDKIVLYTKEDREKYGIYAKPVKTVHFEYSYELCKGVPYNALGGTGQNGKLTLKMIWFTYGNTTQGALSPYQFVYSSKNPDYDSKAVDRWGTFRTINCTDSYNDDFSYTKQDKTSADINASAWNLTEINLPSGGKIEVQYEADDYGYVQDKEAMEMFDVVAVGESSTFSSSKPRTHLYGSGLQKRTYRYIFFNLPAGVNAANIREKMMPPDHGIYFKFLVDLDSKGHFEYVSGYAKVADQGNNIGVDNSSGLGFVYVDDVHVSGNDNISANPISKAAWQKTRVELPHLIHPESDKFKSNTSSIDQVGRALVGVGTRIGQMLAGINLYMLTNLFAESIKLDGYSVIRLKSPNKKKIGGGHRVKKILMHDEWDAMTSSEESQTLGQVYDYSTTDEATKETISSGVATYEPMVGGDENPHKYPLDDYGDHRALAINDVFHFEGPIGESFYPSPSVGYSKITVRNIKPSDISLSQSITRHGTGKSEFEFYTAYDFPIVSEQRFDRKDLSSGDFGTIEILSFFGLNIDYKALTQGFAIVLNDMHGKPKAKSDFAEGDDQSPISYIKYKYKVEDENVTHKKLNNKVTLLNRDGTVSTDKLMGIETELVFDTQKDTEYGGTVGFEPNFNLVIVPPPVVTIPVPTFFFEYSNFYLHEYRRVAATKLVNMYGILDEVEVMEEGSVIKTKNTAFDGETGEVLLTQTQNEYSDDIFNFSYPAHWAYEGMGPAYVDMNYVFSGNIVNGPSSMPGYMTVSAATYALLTEGDELARIDNNPHFRAWVVRKVASNQIVLIDELGNPIPNGSNRMFKVIRSGRRNLQNTPIGKIVSTKNPINFTTHTFAVPSEFGNDVINASAIEFSDKWQLYADKIQFGKGAGQNSSLSSAALAYVGFMQNLIFSNKLLTDGEKIDSYVNAPKANPVDRDERGALAYIYGIIPNPLQPFDPIPDITRLEWDIQASPPANTLVTKIICNPGGSGCTGNLCDFSIKMYEPIFGDPNSPNYGDGHSILHDINTLLPLLTFDKDDNNIKTKFIVNKNYFTQKYEVTFPLFATNGKQYNFVIETACVYYIPYYYCGFNYSGTSSSLVKDNLYNPFRWNARGSWAPKKSFVYYDTRNTEFARSTSSDATASNATNMRVDGKLQNFIPYWHKESGKSFWSANFQDNGYTPWTWNSELTIRNPYGLELESKDALGIYSAAVYGNNNTVPIAVAGNAKLNQFCYDGFEEPKNSEGALNYKHFKFLYDVYAGTSVPTPTERVKITDKEAHTGRYSAQIAKRETADASQQFALAQSLSILTSINDLQWQWPSPGTSSSSNADTNFTKVKESDVIKNFSPEPGGEYIISYWVKFDEAPSNGTLNCQLRYYNPVSFYTGIYDNLYDRALDENCSDVTGFNTVYNSYYLERYTYSIPNFNIYTSMTATSFGSPITINGWKREQIKFTIPANAPNLKINFINTATNTAAYVDDVRIFPYKANMKSYAFDFFNRRLMAELDENNYATFYEYDDQGSLIRVKRETEEGIITINENRSNIKSH